MYEYSPLQLSTLATPLEIGILRSITWQTTITITRSSSRKKRATVQAPRYESRQPLGKDDTNRLCPVLKL